MPAAINRRTFGVLAAGAGLAALAGAAKAGTAAPPDARPAAFRRGVNLSHWLQYDGRQPITADDLALIARAGFDHVRLPFDPGRMGWRAEGSRLDAPLPPAALNQLEKAIDLVLAAGLSVIVDCHPESDLVDHIEREEEGGRALVGLWAFLARRLAGRPPARMAFEPLNEPQYYRQPVAAWNRLQAQLLGVIREVSPDVLVLLAGVFGSSVDGLLRIAPLPDPMVRHVFHFYEPMLLTHLNAPWEPFKSGPQGQIDGLEYPAARLTRAGLRLRPGADMGRVNAAVREYRDAGWNEIRVAGRIAEAALWAKRNGVQLMCTEFGGYAYGSAGAGRLRWMADVRQALERFHIGWTVWDYADLFGIARPADSAPPLPDLPLMPRDLAHPVRVFDTNALTALNML